MVAALRGTPGAAFANPTRCPPWTVAQELAHTVLACSRLEAMLAQPEPEGPEIGAAQYFRRDERFGAAADELQRQLGEAMDQMLILGISDLSQLTHEFAPLFSGPASYSMVIVYRPARESDEQAASA